ncbi:enterochelin esterase [Erwinia sp. V71]|uniref:enterochelin esterase n=1 Tax=Erwinia sp. V71 TaxID=3369424 RepID=UPI003F61EB29
MAGKNRMPALQPEGSAARLLAADNRGQQAWWQQLAQIGTPLVEAQSGNDVTMSYFWRDPAGNEHTSPTVKVYIDINGITDHHSPDPEHMQRIAGTDIWHWSTVVDARWRGGYNLIPIDASKLPPEYSDDPATASQQQREWWMTLLLEHTIADPLNPLRPHFNSRRKPLSSAHMPHAPVQAGWQAYDAGEAVDADAGRLQRFHWQSTLLANQRPVWLYTTGDTAQPDQRPLIIMLDGQNWAQNIPIWSALDSQTAAGLLPAACWLFIDVIDLAHRGQELPCNEPFWQAVQQELLPQARRYATFSEEADRTVVTGQSYGGLAALYAGLFWPQRFGRILSQSGSFWWPDPELLRNNAEETGWLTRQVTSGDAAHSGLTIFMESGTTEADIGYVNQQMLQALKSTTHQVSYREYIGGHDNLCWRGGLIDGLQALLAGFIRR